MALTKIDLAKAIGLIVLGCGLGIVLSIPAVMVFGTDDFLIRHNLRIADIELFCIIVGAFGGIIAAGKLIIRTVKGKKERKPSAKLMEEVIKWTIVGFVSGIIIGVFIANIFRVNPYIVVLPITSLAGIVFGVKRGSKFVSN